MDSKRVIVLHFTNGMSSREIAETNGDGKATINEFLKRFQQCGVLKYPLPEDVTNEFIGELLYRKGGNLAGSEPYRNIDPEAIHRAMKKKGETQKYLWKKNNASGVLDGRRPLNYRKFCRYYSQWLDSTKVTCHIQLFPGVNLEVDFGRKTLYISRIDIIPTKQLR